MGGFHSYSVCCQAQTPSGHASSHYKFDCETINQGGGSASSTATATCPSGSQVTGGGFSDIDQNGGGSASDEFSSHPTGNGWYVRFDDEVGGFNSYARCCKYTSLSNLVPRAALQCRTEQKGGGSASTAITAQCRSDEYVMGGGFHDIDQNGGGSASDEFSSKPVSNGWYVR